MATRPEDEEQTEDKAQVSTPQLDRLERLAKAAQASAVERKWKARKNGLNELEEPSEVRNVTHNADARAQAEAAMQQMMAKSKGTPRRR